MCGYMLICGHMCVNARSPHWMASCIIPNFIFEIKLTDNSARLDPPVSASQHPDYRPTIPLFYLGAGDMNSDPHRALQALC